MEKATPVAPFHLNDDVHSITRTRRAVLTTLAIIASTLVLAVPTLYLRSSIATGLHSFSSKPQAPLHRNVTKIGDVHWWSTEDPDISDGQVMIPVDYKNHTKGHMILGLRRLRAQVLRKEKKGTVFLNSGGPGGDASHWTFEGIKGIATARVGPYYDIVGFSPRGVGNSIPRVECFSSPETIRQFVANTPLQQGIDLHPNPGSLAARQDIHRAMAQIQAMHEVQGALCAKNMNVEMLKYMGTTYVARDIDFLTTVLEGEESLINYWSGSYGSVLGAYLVNMFPDRVGRVSVDGIVDAKLWADVSADYALPQYFLFSTDDAYARFVHDCVEAGPEACSLLSFGDTTDAQLINRIDDFLNELYYHPLPIIDERRPAVLTSGAVRATIAFALEIPSRWSLFSKTLAEAMAGNGTAIYRIIAHNGEADMARQAVTCADTPPMSLHNRTSWPTADDLTSAALRAVDTMSKRWALAYLALEPGGGCAYWPANKLEEGESGTAAERFAGPWNHTLKNPILIVSAKDDPITPLVNAQSLHKRLQNSSALLVQDSAGHSTVLTASLCTAKHSVRYFTEGTLPPPGTVCSLDVTPFGNSEADRRPKSKQEKAILKGVDDILGSAFGRLFERA